MNEIHEITYDGKTYKVYEPTLDLWSELMNAQLWDNDFELAITLISWITGLSREEIAKASAISIINAADGLIDYYTTQSSVFYDTFEYNGKRYKFIDLPNLSFGEFIDIDELLQKPQSEKNKRLNELMSLLYREIDDNGDYLDYDINRIKKTAMDFRKLPIKYLNGSLVFFYNIRNILDGNIRFSLTSKIWWKVKWIVLKKRIKTLSAGSLQSLLSPWKILQKWKKSLRKTILNVLTS